MSRQRVRGDDVSLECVLSLCIISTDALPRQLLLSRRRILADDVSRRLVLSLRGVCTDALPR